MTTGVHSVLRAPLCQGCPWLRPCQTWPGGWWGRGKTWAHACRWPASSPVAHPGWRIPWGRLFLHQVCGCDGVCVWVRVSACVCLCVWERGLLLLCVCDCACVWKCVDYSTLQLNCDQHVTFSVAWTYREQDIETQGRTRYLTNKSYW